MALAIAAAAVASSWLATYTGLPDAPVLFVVLLFAVTLFEPLDLIVQARGRVGASMWTDTLRSLLTFPLQFGLIVPGFGAAGMAYGLAAATFLTVPVLWVLRPNAAGRAEPGDRVEPLVVRQVQHSELVSRTGLRPLRHHPAGLPARARCRRTIRGRAQTHGAGDVRDDGRLERADGSREPPPQ